MAYMLTTPDQTGTELLRVLRDEVRGAVADLRDGGHTPEDIHSARKHLKKARSVLRLARGPLGKRRRPANEVLRDAGRTLSPLRDQDAMLEALDKAAPALGPEAAHALWEELVRRKDAARSGHDPATVPAVAERLEALEDEMADWVLPGRGFEPLAEGLEISYGRGRDLWKRMREDPGPGLLHEWRKRVKDHWYHLRLVVDAWPEGLAAREAALDHLSDLLGDDHDLAVLRDSLREGPALPETMGSPEAVDHLLAGRQRELQREALALGRRVYAEKPKAFRKRAGRYWAAWLAEAEAEADERLTD
ncbi:CHAD domain-containing protein [Thiohalorhabdus methylotrophus]|uniref:CHAD domain-containing protein n=1 Tax=Thiohalorhabdus methylotrophus TaxID=3242694 RepID=A0ABV4TWI2_9GAMM